MPLCCMDERYEPASEFLKAIVAEEAPISETGFGAENLRRLISMTRDRDVSNRDWATMLLSQQDLDTPEVRFALLQAVSDENDAVRAEALLGLAKRDPVLALPYAREALAKDYATMPVFEAAELIADPSLVELLQPWTEDSGDTWLDDVARRAVKACETASAR